MTEREHVDQFWPHEDYAIVRKPLRRQTKRPATEPPRGRGFDFAAHHLLIPVEDFNDVAFKSCSILSRGRDGCSQASNASLSCFACSWLSRICRSSLRPSPTEMPSPPQVPS